MNDICIDIDYSQLYKHGQQIGGDVFLLDHDKERNRISCTLSDGLGSGVKAHVLASLTAHMGHKLSFSPIRLDHSAQIIMDALPVDKEKGISYSTFTIAQAKFTPNKDNINISLVEYDNPESLRFHNSEVIEWEKESHKLSRKAAVKEEVIKYSEFKMSLGDRLIFFSDGVAQAGIGLGPGEKNADVGSKGWGTDKVKDFIRKKLEEDPHISSRDLARAIVTKAYSYDNCHANDDITCAVINVRKPRRTLIVTGAPIFKEYDKQLADIINNFDGKKIVCGGTTSKIVARELGRELRSDPAPAGKLPPSSLIDGIDLVTEGMVTLTEITDRLEEHVLLKNMSEDAAKRFIKIMRETDQVQLVVGTKINDAAENDTSIAHYGIRIPLIARFSRIITEKYGQEVEIKYL